MTFNHRRHGVDLEVVYVCFIRFVVKQTLHFYFFGISFLSCMFTNLHLVIEIIINLVHKILGIAFFVSFISFMSPSIF